MGLKPQGFKPTASAGHDAADLNPQGGSAVKVCEVGRKLQCFQTLRIGTWNIRSMSLGKLDVIKAEMDRMDIDILGISELKWTGKGHFDSGDKRIFFCGHDTNRKNGVAIIANKKAVKSIIENNPMNDRMIAIRLQGAPINVTVIQVYAPTTDASQEEIEEFYASLQDLYKKIPKKDIKLIVGDFNSKVGSIKTDQVTGSYGLGERNEAGERLIEFCQENELVIANTLFQQPKRRLYTWTSPNGLHRNQIDYILREQRWKSSIKVAKTRPGADCGTDHQLLISDFRLRLKRNKRPEAPKCYTLENIPTEYRVQVQNRFSQLACEECSAEKQWEEASQIIKEAAEEHIPPRRKQKRSKWLSNETIEIANKRKEAKKAGNREEHRRLNAEFQRLARRDKDIYWNKVCGEIEEANKTGKTRNMFQLIRMSTGTFKPKMDIIKDENGHDLTDSKEIKNRWRSYTEDLYSDKNNEDMDENAVAGENEPDILESEVREAMNNIANNKSPGCDNIPIELLKALKDDGVKLMHNICQKIWTTKQWPKDWKRSIFIPIPKKGDRRECSNHRTIALISHASKIMLKILQGRMKQHVDQEIPAEQAGFVKGRGTRDQIANLRWTIEKAQEYQKPLFLCFIDYTKAFDCIKYHILWKVLQQMGIPQHLVELIKNLYEDQEAAVRTPFGLTEWFNIQKGVRQGCILSPWLFNLYAEHIMRKAGLDEAKEGVKIAGKNINNLRYADDTTLLAESKEDLERLIYRVKEESALAGLFLNIKKTKIMTTEPIDEWKMNDEEVEVVDNFVFLGSNITYTGDCSAEIRRRLALGRQAMTNLKKTVQNKDLKLATKIRIVKAMVFPVALYGCETWTIKKADRRKIDAFEMWCWRRLLRVSWTEKRTNKSILQEINPDSSLEGMI